MRMQGTLAALMLLLHSGENRQLPGSPNLNHSFHLHGTVFWSSEGCAELVLDNTQIIKTVRLHPNSNYELDLPVGTWTMTMPNSSYKRVFQVLTEKDVKLDISCPEPTRSYRYFDMPAEGKGLYDLLVVYDDYWWNPWQHYFFKGINRPAHAEYNLTTIYADHIFVKKKESTLKVDGAVTIEDGTGAVKNFHLAVLQLKNGTVRIVKAE